MLIQVWVAENIQGTIVDLVEGLSILVNEAVDWDMFNEDRDLMLAIASTICDMLKNNVAAQPGPCGNDLGDNEMRDEGEGDEDADIMIDWEAT